MNTGAEFQRRDRDSAFSWTNFFGVCLCCNWILLVALVVMVIFVLVGLSDCTAAPAGVAAVASAAKAVNSRGGAAQAVIPQAARATGGASQFVKRNAANSDLDHVTLLKSAAEVDEAIPALVENKRSVKGQSLAERAHAKNL